MMTEEDKWEYDQEFEEHMQMLRQQEAEKRNTEEEK